MHLLLPGGFVNPGKWEKGLYLMVSISSVTLEVRYFSAE